MSILTTLRKWTSLLPAVALLALLAAVLSLYPSVAVWARYPSLYYLPYVLLAIAFILGFVFTQSRLSFICALLLVVTFLVNRTYFERPEAARGEAVLLLAAIGVPVVVAWLHRLGERGVFTVHGLLRLSIVVAAGLLLFFVPRLPAFARGVEASSRIWVDPPWPWLGVSPLALLTLAGAAVLLAFRKPHESPMLGPLFALAIVFVLNALNFRSSWWRPEAGHAVFLAFSSGAAATLLWAILESSWRHANIDELTQLPGRRPLKHHFACLGSMYAVAILDIDHFKRVNDRHGHDVGDQVLRLVSSFLRSTRAGKAYRFGGEEFVIVCEGRTAEEAAPSLDELREEIGSRPFRIRSDDRPNKKPDKKPAAKGPGKGEIRVTVSIGVAGVRDGQTKPQEALDAADKALYKAKRSGRNRVCIAPRKPAGRAKAGTQARAGK